MTEDQAFTESRRCFLTQLGLATTGVAVAGYARSGEAASPPRPTAGPNPFPTVKPKEVRVSRKGLKELVDYIESEREAGTFPGAGILALRHGRLFLEHFSGTYEGGDNVAHPFHGGVRVPLYSFSKAISATIVVMARQKGLLDYDVPVSTYIPEFVGSGKETITLRHLLTHAAGIPNAPLGGAATEEEWRDSVKKVCAAEVEWEPGSKTQYHGATGLFVAAEAVRRVSGMKPWNDLCRERLFEPIGAESLSFLVPESGPGSLDAFGPGGGGHPAGGCVGALIDVLRVVQLHLNKGVWQGTALLKPAAFEEMHTVQYAAERAEDVAAGRFLLRHEPWGLGWLLRGEGPQPPAAYWFGFGKNKSPKLFGHAGIDTIMAVGDPALDLAYAFVVTKSIQDEAKTTRLRGKVANLLFAAVQ